MKTYVVYKGDDIVAIGSKQEAADQLGVKPSTVEWMATPVGRRRSRMDVEVVCEEGETR